MAGREHLGAEVAGGGQEVAELDRLVAFDARHRGLARHVALGKAIDHRLLEAAFVVEDVVGDADGARHPSGVVNVLAGAAGALAMDGGAMIVELQGNADDVVAFVLQQRGGHRGIDASRHGDNHAGILRPALDIQTVQHPCRGLVPRSFFGAHRAQRFAFSRSSPAHCPSGHPGVGTRASGHAHPAP